MLKADNLRAAPTSGRVDRILDAPRNCWRVVHSNRVAFLVDSAAYFAELNRALHRATRSIMIIGWDFDGQITLERDCRPGAAARSLRQLLGDLVKARPELEIRVLIWDASVFYAPSAIASYLAEKRQSHPRIRVKFDNQHPIDGCHHQKIVCIDNALAFVGGIDLTRRRWDTPRHEPGDPLRIDPDGRAYRPVHDIQVAIDGAAAGAVGEIARARWRQATGECLTATVGALDPWPDTLAPALRNAPVGIARTCPPTEASAAVREIEALTVDAVAAAVRWIYIEAQYLSNFQIGELLADRLQRPTGPEIVVVVRCQADGWLEHLIMATNRDRLLRRLKAADRHGRLRAYYPVVPGASETDVSIHSKLIIVDGRFIKVGSSNLNNRSMGLDTECDVAVEAEDDETGRAIVRLRDRLLAEHLGTDVEAVEAASERCNGLIAMIEMLNTGARGLRPHEPRDGSADPLPGTALLDPDEPFDLQYLWRS